MLSISGLSPSEGQKNVELDSIIEFFILDDDTGIDISSLIVYIDGDRAISDAEFQDGFSGEFSEIVPDGDNYLISVDPEDDFGQGKTKLVKIQVKDLDGKYFNISYVFKTIPAKPILTLQSPKSGAILKTPQTLYLEFTDVIDGVDHHTVNIKINSLDIVVNGEFESGYEGDYSEVKDITDGVSVKIDKEEPFRDNTYKLDYNVQDTNGNMLAGSFSFSVELLQAVLPAVFPQTGFIGPQGITRAMDLGIGDSINLEWNQPTKRYYGSDIFVLIYRSDQRLEVFDDIPKYIATSDVHEVAVDGLVTGDTVYFAARALEAYKDSIGLDGLVEVDDGLYEFPEATEVATTVLDTDMLIRVVSTDGYPSTGTIKVGGEVMRYSDISETQTGFIISTNGRGLNNTSVSVHTSGEDVEFFTACQDSNQVIVAATPTYHADIDHDREIDSTGIVVNDYSDNDRKFFQGFDFCGYHMPLPQQIFQGVNDCGSYLGGEFNGMRGMNLFDRMLNREEVLLDQTGEPTILLKRIWDGQTCSCNTMRGDHPKMKMCKDCFGTGYEGGFEIYENLRREDRRTMISFADTLEDLLLDAHKSLEQQYEPTCWTLPIPAIKDRDLVVRFDFTDDTEYIYEVLNVTKEKLIYKHYSRQRLSLKRLDKTDIVYTFPFLE